MQEIIEAFIANFYGYGNLGGKYWFIGMEEGCGPTWETDVEPRFTAWNERGRQTTEHLRDYHAAIGIVHHWQPVGQQAVQIQRTWRRLVQTVLTAEGNDAITVQQIAAYQAQQLGTPQGQTCLLELLPLPSPRLGVWPYAHLANQIPYLASRPGYRQQVRPGRIAGLRTLIAERKPPHVVFYGQSYLDEWTAVAGGGEWVKVEDHIQSIHVGATTFWLVPHPNARGLPADVFTRLGVLMRG